MLTACLSVRRSTRRPARGVASGFTLIELLIVMTLLVILAGISLGLYTNSVTRANESALATNLRSLRDALDQYYADKNKYPPTLETLVAEKYIRTVPVDPFTRSSGTWVLVLSEPDPGNPAAEVGVFDVKSGSDRTAIDQTRYSDW